MTEMLKRLEVVSTEAPEPEERTSYDIAKLLQ
jgi:hypothetical protein